MIPMNTIYNEMGIRETVLSFGKNIEKNLKDRFEKIDEIAEYNQLKVIKAMQDNRVSAGCFNYASGYGYDDQGRDTLEKVYASIPLFFIQKLHSYVRRSLAEHMLCHSHLRQI